MTYVVDHTGAAAWLGLAGRWPADVARDGGSMVNELVDAVADLSWLIRQPAPAAHTRQDIGLVCNAFELFPASGLWDRALALRNQLDAIEPALSLALAELLDLPLITLDARLREHFGMRVVWAG